MAAPTVVQYKNTTFATTTKSFVTGTLGSTPVFGNVLFAILSVTGATAPSVATGWTLIAQGTTVGTLMAYRRVVAGDTTSNIPAVGTLGTASEGDLNLWEVSGGGTNVPLALGKTNNAATATVTVGSFIPGQSGALMLASAYRTGTTVGTITTPPTDTPGDTFVTDIASHAINAGTSSAAAAHTTDPTAATYNQTWTEPTSGVTTMRCNCIAVYPLLLPHQPNYQRAPILAQ